MRWHCWGCRQEFQTSGLDERPRCCPGVGYTPVLADGVPYDHEDVVMMTVTTHGGSFGAQRGRSGMVTTVVWFPPEVAAPPDRAAGVRAYIHLMNTVADHHRRKAAP